MEIKFRAKIKNINAKEGGTVIQLEPQAGYAEQIVGLMPRVGMYALVGIEDEQMEIEELEAEYEQPIDGQTEIGEDVFEPVVICLPEGGAE